MRKRHSRHSRLSGVSNLVGAFVLLTLPFTVAGSANSIKPETHCVASVGTIADSSASAGTCYLTFAEAIAVATDGRVHLANASRSRAVSAAELAPGVGGGAVVPNTTVVIGIDYMDPNFQGSTFTWTAPAACGNYQTSSEPTGWDNKISSVAAFSNCATTLHDGAEFGNPAFLVTVNGSAGSLGTFNDKTSSEKWCAAYPCG
jgi:hypothetical protein